MPDPMAILTTTGPLEQVTAAVRRYCGWHIAPQITETLTLDGSGTCYLPLPSLHVVDVLSVTEGGLLLDPGSYQWTTAGMLWRPYAWTGAYRSVVVELTHGYTLPEVRDVAGALAAKAARLDANPEGVVRRQAGPFSEEYETASGFTPSEESTLAAYRILGRP